MKDKSWLLNPAAIAAAKSCIQAIESELSIKLKLSHPQFEEMIQEYCELTDSATLISAYQELKVFSKGVVSMTESQQKVVTLKKSSTANSAYQKIEAEDDSIVFKGKTYSRFDEQGLEFKGLYRGQARYA